MKNTRMTLKYQKTSQILKISEIVYTIFKLLMSFKDCFGSNILEIFVFRQTTSCISIYLPGNPFLHGASLIKVNLRDIKFLIQAKDIFLVLLSLRQIQSKHSDRHRKITTLYIWMDGYSECSFI